jgi:NAD(P)-dependent dehydrogenase (short-subunit alcohol dehydrogenase family)
LGVFNTSQFDLDYS